ncbi:MAG: AAA family ATPase [bacterium]|nr:AAA family ATPase [bacterium]
MKPNGPHFTLEHPLGAGASGDVYLGQLTAGYGDLDAGAELAVKVARSAEAERAFVVEGEVGAAVRHPHLVHVVYAGPSEHGHVVLMEHISGALLADVYAEPGTMPEPRVRVIGSELAGALAALHGAGWVHGDVKPDNARFDAQKRATLLDLGFARRVGARDGQLPGSLAYLSPERIQGRPPEPASDVFALGVLLYELATDLHPFLSTEAATGGARDEALQRLAAAHALPPSAQVPNLSPLFDELVGAMLLRDPARRPTAAEVELVLSDGEASAWWRERIAFHAGARRDRSAWSVRERLPLVGRERELARLRTAYETVLGCLKSDGDRVHACGSVVWLAGEPGAGKTRLVTEFVRRVRATDDPPFFLYGRCIPFEEEQPGQPVIALLRRWLQLPSGPAGRRERALLQRLTSSSVTGSLIACLSPEPDAGGALSNSSALAHWLADLGCAGPLIVFLDDVHFADATTLETLRQLVLEMNATPLVLLLGYTSAEPAQGTRALADLRARTEAVGAHATLELGALETADVLAIVETLFDHSAPRLRLAKVLHERSHGTPGWIEEILRTLEARGDVRPAPGGDGLELLIAPEQIPLPRSLPRSIGDRFRALPATERSWLQRLAVVGGKLESGFLARAFDLPRSEVEEILERFVRHGWLAPSASRYRFAQPIERRAVYRSTRPARRVKIHARAARALETGSLNDAYQRAYHLRAAGEHASLLGVLIPLLAPLLAGGHPQRVRRLAGWGLEAIDALEASEPQSSYDELRIRLLEAAADAADRLGTREQQRELLDRLSDLDLDLERDPDAVGRVYLLHGRYAIGVGHYGLARGMLHNARLAFEKSGDAALESEAARRLAHIQGDAGEIEAALVLARHALERAQGERLQALARLAIAQCHLRDDAYVDALDEIDRAITGLRRVEAGAAVRGPLAAAFLLRARTLRLMGRRRRALASILRARRLASRSGERRLEVEVATRYGRLLIDLSREHEAELVLRDALLLAREIEDRRGQALATLFLGTLLAEEGDHEGGAQLDRASALARKLGLQRVEMLCLALRARVAWHANEERAALGLSERALEQLEHQGAELADRVVIVATRAMLLEATGSEEEARRLDRELQQQLGRANGRLVPRGGKRRQKRSFNALLTAARSADGPVYPRLVLSDPID